MAKTVVQSGLNCYLNVTAPVGAAGVESDKIGDVVSGREDVDFAPNTINTDQQNKLLATCCSS